MTKMPTFLTLLLVCIVAIVHGFVVSSPPFTLEHVKSSSSSRRRWNLLLLSRGTVANNHILTTTILYTKDDSWQDEHLIHGASAIHEETEEELEESEAQAAWDARGCDDPGMEAACEERAVMLANEMANEKHLIHGASEIHEETEEELKESEAQAAWDAHDCDDPGMEAACEERAVMLANEMARKLKEKAAKQSQNGKNEKC